MELHQNFILFFTIQFKDLSGLCYPVTTDVFFTSLGGSDRAKECRIPLIHAVTAFRKQMFTHTVTYNAGKRKFYNFHVWHLPQGSAFKPTHYVCLTAVRGWTVSTELWLYIIHIIHIYIQFFRTHILHTENLSAVVGMRKTISIRWSGVMLRVYTHGRINKNLISSHSLRFSHDKLRVSV